MEKDNLDKLILKSAPEKIEPSSGFEGRFWQKLSERQNAPHPIGIFEWVPVPSFSQAAAIVLIALMIGGVSGIVSALNAPPAVRSLSGFHEIKGVPSVSVAGAYLNTIGQGDLK
ncbi:MAG: hypothetical protein HZC17_07890 [Candidatus Omnitrophica bacterium]|nr:hypothetical protein [Candidatus Omnitrophota bacterium]